MELVPFFEKWTGSETKLDLKAIYRRPDPKGVTLTSPLPLRRHKDFASKGFEFVCLATLGDLGLVANDLRANGYDPLPMRSAFDRDGNFDVPAYLRMAKAGDDAYLADLQAKVDKYGVDVVTDMMRMSDATFTMPASIVPSEPKGKAK